MRIPRSQSAVTALAAVTLSVASTGFAADEKAAKITFEDHVFPIFENKCLNCHNPDEAKGGLDLSSYGATMTGGSGGAIVNAGDHAGSRLYTLASHTEEPVMPPKGDKAPEKDLNLIKDWINGGLLETSSSKAKKADKPKLDMSLLSNTGAKPEGPPPMPEHLILQPEIVTERPTSVPALAHSPWAPILAVAGQKQVLLYHSADFELLGVLPYPEGFPQSLSFSANGSLLSCGGGRGGKNGGVVVWDIKTGERVIEVGKEFDIVLGSDISPDHQRVVLGGPGKLIKIWDTVAGEQVQSIKKHPDWMLTASYSPDGVLFATGGRNGGLYVWEAETGIEFYTLKGHSGAVTDLAWRPDGNVLASISEDGQIRLWEMNEGKEVKKWDAHKGGGLAIAIAPDGKMVSGGRDKKVKIWKPDGSLLKEVSASDDIIMSVAFSEDSKRVIAGDWLGNIKVWDAEGGSELATINSNPPTIDQQIAYSRKRITDLTTELPKLEQDLKQTTVQVAQIRVKTEEAKKAAAAAVGKRAAMEKQVADLTNQIKGQEATQKAQTEALAKAQADLKAKTEGLNAIVKAKTDAQNGISKWTGEVKKREAELAAANQALAAAKAELAKQVIDPATQTALNNAIAAQKAADAAVKTHEAAIAAATKTQQEHTAKLAAAQKVVNDRRAPRDQSRQNADAAAKALQAAEGAFNTANAAVVAASQNGATPAAELMTAKDSAQNARNQAAAAADLAKKEAESRQNEFAAAEKAVAQANAEKAAADQKLAEARNGLKPLQDKLAAANTALKPLRDKEAAIADAKTKANELVAQRTQQQAAFQKALNDQKGQLAAAQKAFDDNNGKIAGADAAKKAAEGILAKATETLKSSNQVLADNRAKLKSVNGELAKAAQLAEASEKQKTDAEAQLKSVATKETEVKKTIEVAKAEMQEKQYLVKKFEAAAVNYEVKEESENLDGMIVELEDMAVDVVEATEEHKRAEVALKEAEKTLASAKKTVADGTTELAKSTDDVLASAIQLAAARAVANAQEVAVAGMPDAEDTAALSDASAPTEEAPIVTEPEAKEAAAEVLLAEKSREEIEEELSGLRSRLSQLQGFISNTWKKAEETEQVVAKASDVAAKTPAVIDERAKVEGAKESEMKEVLTEQQKQEKEVQTQKQRIEQLRKKYFEMVPERA